MISACGVICSDCPAYHAKEKGIEYQQRLAEAWHRIYGLNEAAGSLSCGGCFGPDEEVFHNCRGCDARNCCRSNFFGSCAECPNEDCPDLEKAQSNWEGVPGLIDTLTPAEFAEFALPYCDARTRLQSLREQFGLKH